MNKNNPRVATIILEAVNNQLSNLDPPETKETYQRLVAGGLSDKKARQLIASALSNEMFYMLESNEEFSLERYTAALRKIS